MKEITRIHLAKTAYDIEIAAKEELAKYLDNISSAMGDSDDTMYEIEARMVELLGERGVVAGGVISTEDVSALRKQMGEPNEFSDGESEMAQAEIQGEASKPARQLMRDTDRAVIGGVGAGIAAYWGVNPFWIRMAFIVLGLFTFGAAFILYIVLWISMPEARTAAEKLQMRGEAVTFDSLKKAATSDESRVPVKNTGRKVFQFILTVFLLITAVSLAMVLVVGAIAGAALAASMEGLSAQSWAIGMLVSAVVAGIAAVTLFGVLAYAAAKWEFSRTAAVSSIVSIVVGVLGLAGITAAGIQYGGEISKDYRRLAKVITVDLPESAKNVKHVKVTGDDVFVSRNAALPGDIKAEVHYIDHKLINPPQVRAIVEGETLYIHVDNDNGMQCGDLPIPGWDCNGPAQVKVYGPVELEYGYDL